MKIVKINGKIKKSSSIKKGTCSLDDRRYNKFWKVVDQN